MDQAVHSTDDAGLVPGRVLRIYGMRRSGNHALINWIMRNAPGGNGLFLNDCRHGGDPVLTCSSLSLFESGTETGQGGKWKRIDRAGAKPFTAISYEDRVPPAAPKRLFAAAETLVIIYRSFLHWTASLLRKIQGNVGFGPLDRNRIMGRALSTYSDMLDRMQHDDVVPLCYDNWTADERYRKEALARLDLPGCDLSLGGVQRFGGGSSFQDATEASDLQTDQRSAQMAEDHEYRMLLWTAARDDSFMTKLAHHFPGDAKRLEQLRRTASAQVVLP
ncbi:hypothetical protein [Tateyamaria omphalii]|uniref:Sulfotransferase family protein n=1 Tax=Tateyamaria omphalii TaxID=299262 RepID=A0A1P8MQW4_9RHOB|nr:hypothetical protein [Tateyamaria omphalii]APX10448.1 hypothetical protein BWR18_01070 [Tateyamaria omphalii]